MRYESDDEEYGYVCRSDFDQQDADESEDTSDKGYCGACAGSGEGQYENTTCYVCKGRGQ